MNPFGFLKKREDLLAVDIGTGAVKIIELSAVGEQFTLESFAVKSLQTEIFSNNIITKPEQLSEIISGLIQSDQTVTPRVVVSLPAPAVFTKRIKMLEQDRAELKSSIQFEAANFIPHKIDAVKLDYAVLGQSAKNLDILVVAVKKELLESFESCLALSGLEAAVADVDFFALHNIFEINYKDIIDQSKAYALVDVGQRYSSVVITHSGIPVFVGDISVGLKQLEEQLSARMGLSVSQCRAAVQDFSFAPEMEIVVSDFIGQISNEISRQLSFFWSACGIDAPLSGIFVAGGAALLPGFVEALKSRAEIECSPLDPLKKIAVSSHIDRACLDKVAPLLSVAIGLGMRSSGDSE